MRKFKVKVCFQRTKRYLFKNIWSFNLRWRSDKSFRSVISVSVTFLARHEYQSVKYRLSDFRLKYVRLIDCVSVKIFIRDFGTAHVRWKIFANLALILCKSFWRLHLELSPPIYKSHETYTLNKLEAIAWKIMTQKVSLKEPFDFILRWHWVYKDNILHQKE